MDKLCPWISTQFFARRVCSVTKFAGRAEKRPHCEKLSWTRQDIVTSRTWIRRFGVLRWATQVDVVGAGALPPAVRRVLRLRRLKGQACDGTAAASILAGTPSWP